jgi:hypothetical protein
MSPPPPAVPELNGREEPRAREERGREEEEEESWSFVRSQSCLRASPARRFVNSQGGRERQREEKKTDNALQLILFLGSFSNNLAMKSQATSLTPILRGMLRSTER